MEQTLESSFSSEQEGSLHIEGSMDFPLMAAHTYVENASALREALGLSASAPLALAPLAQGEHNANFLLTDPTGRRFVLRINYSSQLGLSNQIIYEFSALKALSHSGRTPKPLFVDDSRKFCTQGVLVEEYLPGVLLNLENQAQVSEVARVLADIHSTPVDESCGLLKPPHPLQEQLNTSRALFTCYCESSFAEPDVIKRVEGFFTQAQAAVDSYLKGRVSEVSNSGDREGEVREQAHVINTEAVPSHFLFDETGLGYMVDWEKPILGDPAQDIAYFLSPTSTIWDTEIIFSQEERAAFVEEYCRAAAGRFSLEEFRETLPLYVMTNALIGITWSCNAWVEYHDPNRPLQNEKTRQKLTIYRDHDFLDKVEQLCFTGV